MLHYTYFPTGFWSHLVLASNKKTRLLYVQCVLQTKKMIMETWNNGKKNYAHRCFFQAIQQNNYFQN